MDVRAKVVEAVMQYGPHYSQISKVTGIPISTVRYIITKIMPKFGLFIRPAINYGMLGLQRYLVKFDTPYPPQYISVLLDLFGEIMYLDYYTFLMKSRKFLTTFVVPLEFENDFSLFINELKDLNIIKNYDMKKLKYMRVLPFRVECYDFHNGVWLQNWVRIKRKYSIPEIYEIPISLNITKLDITILAEVHENVFIKYVELAKKLNVTRQTIKKHYRIQVHAPGWNL